MDGSIEAYLLLGFALSAIVSVGGVVAVGIVVVKLSPGYFCDSAVPQPLRNAHALVRGAAVVLKNLAGAALVVLGLIMSMPGIPGPGIITIVLGLMLLDFAEKRRWSRWVMSRPPILRVANGLRRKFGRPPFTMPPPGVANPG